ncbi:MAG: isoaspartyl peptidase/L-asparaginase [Candidatus Dormibacteraeota bacterium]|nr:isoaspartyl peptidase/L-asparaginase [Candidatus Dormibacteraeota bacterium]
MGREVRMKDQAIVVGSTNAEVGIEQAMAVLREGGSPLDAVVAGIREVERNPEDHSVGFSGLPNLLGEVELDASVMEGARLGAGAVGALRGHQDAVELARRVMERLPHVLVVGDGAGRRAGEVGLPEVDLLTPEVRRIWRERLEGTENGNLDESYLRQVRALAEAMAPRGDQPDQRQGTVNLIARDRAGHVVCGVSTSGFPLKYPGRLGDSPVIGAGNYADDRWGAAACTGFGELSLRCCTAHSVVTFMRFGMSLEGALEQAMVDLRHLETPGDMNIVALDAGGRPGAASSVQGKTYIYLAEDMERYVEAERLYIPLAHA